MVCSKIRGTPYSTVIKIVIAGEGWGEGSANSVW